jgi:hypothetical protein
LPAPLPWIGRSQVRRVVAKIRTPGCNRTQSEACALVDADATLATVPASAVVSSTTSGLLP